MTDFLNGLSYILNRQAGPALVLYAAGFVSGATIATLLLVR